jgi:hypothetical protein
MLKGFKLSMLSLRVRIFSFDDRIDDCSFDLTLLRFRSFNLKNEVKKEYHQERLERKRKMQEHITMSFNNHLSINNR